MPDANINAVMTVAIKLHVKTTVHKEYRYRPQRGAQ